MNTRKREVMYDIATGAVCEARNTWSKEHEEAWLENNGPHPDDFIGRAVVDAILSKLGDLGVMNALANALRWPLSYDRTEALKRYDALLAEGSAAEKCFCDEKYPDSNRAATCGDCPRDYEGSASSEGAEAVGEIVSRSDGGMDVQWSLYYNPSPGDRFYTHPQPAQGEQCSALEVFRIAGGDVECTPNPTAKEAMDCLRDLRQCYDESLSEQRSCEGSERRPIAESDVSRACEVFDAATFYSIGGYTFDDYRKRMRAALESFIRSKESRRG